MIRASAVARACYIRPSLLRPLAAFASILDRCAALGFDTAVLPCPFVDDAQWAQARLSDPDRLAPAFAWHDDAMSGLSQLTGLGRERGLGIVLDLRLDEVAAHAPITAAQPQWFRPYRAIGGALPDPRRPPQPATAAIARFDDESVALTRWWSDCLARWCNAGVVGYRCLWPQQVPPPSWRKVMQLVRRNHDARFWAWTPGLDARDMLALADCGFDAAFSSLAWWDFRAHWYLEEDERLRRFASVIASVDDPLALVPPEGDEQSLRRARLRAISFGAATSDGVLVALGADVSLDPAIIEANAASTDLAPGPRRGLRPLLTGAPGPVQALLAERLGSTAHLVLANADAGHIATITVASVLRDAGENAALESLSPSPGDQLDANAAIALEPAEVRIYAAGRRVPVPIDERALPSVAQAVVAPRIAIERVAPAVDGGRFAAKHVVGERVVVSADLLCDGHDLLDGVVLWRALGERDWRRAPMRSLGNDRWCGEFSVDRIGRHEFTIETWLDVFATARMDLEVKRLAGKLIALDVSEACQLVTDAAVVADDQELDTLAAQLGLASDDTERVALLVSPEMSQAMARSGPRPFLMRCPTVFAIEAERRAAGFSSWYELFPRSQAGPDADGRQRHVTFDDVIARLPAIRNMGFDVLYM
ncbi:MAG TPA: maltotransferase domain-containing protein, partial [Lysobacter sp.]|nr:maltotransferase domain-containing protein [Lysobacter sp.]